MITATAGHPVGVFAVLLSAIAATTLAGGCSSHSGTTSTSKEGNAAARHYALLADPSWTLQEARDLRPDDPLATAERPPLDWYDEYVLSSANASQLVRISGHESTFDQSRVELEQQGFVFHAVPLDGWRAVGSRGIPGDTPQSAVLLLDNGDSSLLVGSAEVGLDELIALAAKIEPASAAAWVRAGGVIA